MQWDQWLHLIIPTFFIHINCLSHLFSLMNESENISHNIYIAKSDLTQV